MVQTLGIKGYKTGATLDSGFGLQIHENPMEISHNTGIQLAIICYAASCLFSTPRPISWAK